MVNNSRTARPSLAGPAETLLIPLYNRAVESQRPDALMRDERAEALVASLDYDFTQVTRVHMLEANKAARIMLTREMDRFARDFLSRNPYAVVVHVGCGLDSRFERVDDGLVEWYDLDLPDVIELRRSLIGGDGGRYHLLACSVLGDEWIDPVSAHAGAPMLFLAENVLVYLAGEEVRSLVLKLRARFPGSELVFDGWTPSYVWIGNRMLGGSKFGGLLRWGFWRRSEIERWGEGIRLLGEWGFFDKPEPRLRSVRWAGPLFRLLRPIRILHYQLGDRA